MDKLILIALCIGVACAQMMLQGVVRDQAPSTMKMCGSAGVANNSYGFVGTDFQQTWNNSVMNEKGIAGMECNKANNYMNCGMIGADRTPVYAYTGTSPGRTVASPASFYSWFHQTERTKTMPFALQLTQTSSGSKYSNTSFFPVDGEGWGDSCNGHNFAFCFESHFTFSYTGGEIFEVTTTESVFVYVADMLVVDLGGIHGTETRSIQFDEIRGLTKNSIYKLDFFYCERHTPDSTLKLEFSTRRACSYYDWCGVCEGNGQSCCNQTVKAWCDDKNVCTTDACDKNGCTHTPITCDDKSICTVDSCDAVAGCKYTPVNCDDKNPCTNDACDPKTGCRHTPVNSTNCNPPQCAYYDWCGVCEGDGQSCCNDTARAKCDDKDLCTIDSCGFMTGCRHVPINCDDGNACTTDTCDAKTGCRHTPVNSTNCNPQCAYRDWCGVCEGDGQSCCNSSRCDDKNACTVDTCDPSGGCKHVPKTCDDKNSCTTDECTQNGMCKFTVVTCDDKNSCTNDTCSPTVGCTFTPVNSTACHHN